MTDQLKEIGFRLSALRVDCGLTEEEMADKMGMSIEEYIAYENGERDFSYSFLYNAADVLDVEILDIMSGSSPTLSTCAFVKKGKGFTISQDKFCEFKHLAYTFRNRKADPLLVTVEPTEKEPRMHSHEGHEFNFVVSGKIKFNIGDISYEMSKGDSVYFDATVPHSENAIGDKSAQFIAIVLNK